MDHEGIEKNISFDTSSLSRLFDLQRFAPNDRLAKIISDTESRYGAALSDDELTFVNAAGEAELAVPSDKAKGGTEEDTL